MTASTAAPPATRSRSTILVAAVATLLAFAAGWLVRPVPAVLDPPRVTELTFTGHDSQPALSPDDRLIAFTSTRTGISQIWLRQVDGGSEQPLTEGSDFRPTFSADSQSVAFIRRDGDVYSAYRVAVLGGQPRKLIEDVLEVAWSPDGRSLAFVRGSRVNAAGASLGVLNLESGQERIISTFAGRNVVGPSWSDDSSRIVVTKTGTQGASGDFSLVVFDAAGAELREVDFGIGPRFSRAIWAGNNALIYAKSSTSVTSSPEPQMIARYDLATNRERTLLWEPYLFTLVGVRSSGSNLSILGADRLVFETFRQVQVIHELEVSSGALRALSPAVSADRQPTYSPDGRRLLFTSNRSGNIDLFAYEFDSDRLVQMTDHTASDWDGGYTPDGDSLVWSSDRGGNLEIWIADADGANPRQVTHGSTNAENPTMTADGEWIVYSSGSPDAPGLYKVRPGGGESVLLLAGNWTNPDLSHDGRFALFIRNDPARLTNELGVIEIATGNLIDFRIVVEYSPESRNVAYGRGRWMPGDEAIAFIGIDSESQPTVWIQDFVPGQDTTATRRQPEGMQAAGTIESFGVSPDGTRFALSTIEVIHTIKIADGLGPLR